MNYKVVYIHAEIVFAIMFVVLYALERISRNGRMPRKLNLLYAGFMLSLLLDSTWILIDGIPRLRTANLIVNLVYLSIMASIGYLWFLHTLDIFPANTRLRKYRHLLAIPVIIDLFLVLSSPVTNWVFYIDAGGSYMRAPLHLVSFSINYAYMLLGSYAALLARREAQLAVDKRRLAVAAFFPLPIIVLTGIQLLLPPGLPAFQGGVMISLLLLYANHQRMLVTRDPLTLLPNRYAFESDLFSRTDGFRGDTHLYLMEGDIDGFKHINDTLGHPAGDRFLTITATVLSDLFSPYGSLVFRVGGDEFMIIVESDDPIDADKLRSDLNQRLTAAGKPLIDNLTMSLGITEYTADSNFKSLIESVDIDLYKDKASTKPAYASDRR